MGKYNLGVSNTEVSYKINKNELFVDDAKSGIIVSNIHSQLDEIHASLLNIHSILNQLVKEYYVRGARVDVFKGWAKKSKSQASSAKKLDDLLTSEYSKALKEYPLKLLDDRIAELERKMSKMSDEN